MPHLVVVCQVFHPDSQSTSQLLSDLFRVFVKRAGAVSVYCGFSSTGGPPLSRSEVWEGVQIFRGGWRTGSKESLWQRSLAYASYTCFVMRALFGVGRESEVLVVTNPPFIPVVTGIICRMRRLPFTVMLHDVFPEGLVALGQVRGEGLIDRVWSWANRRTYRAAREVWTLGRDMNDLVVLKYGVPRSKIRYVPHWSAIEVSEPLPLAESRLLVEHGLDGKFIVQYSGNMGLWHDIDTIVRAAALLREASGVHFLMIGDGKRRLQAERLARESGLTNITWLGFRDKEELVDSLACSHVALISQRAGLEGVAVPCKLYGILASGRAVVAQVPVRSETALVVGEEQCGIIVRPDDPQGLASAIASLERDPDGVAEMGRRAFAAYRAKYTLKRAVDTFDRALRDSGTATGPSGRL